MRHARPRAPAYARSPARSRRWRSAGTTGRGFSSTRRRTLRQQLETLTVARRRRPRGADRGRPADRRRDRPHGGAAAVARVGDAGARLRRRGRRARAADGYPVLEMLERYCGADGRRSSRAGAAAGGVEPDRRVLRGGRRCAALRDGAGRGPARRAASSCATARVPASPPTFPVWPNWTTPCSADSPRATSCSSTGRSGGRRDPRLGIADRSARDMGHLPQSGPGGMLEALSGLRATAQGAHPHQQHQPDPGRGLARARGRSSGRASKSPTMASRSSCDRSARS